MSRPDGSAVVGVLDDDVGALPRQRAAGRAGRGEEADLVDRERPLLEEAPHDAADLAGGTDDADAHGGQATRSAPVAVHRSRRVFRLRSARARSRRSRCRCRARTRCAATARPRCMSGAGTTTEMRIVDVEIISMLMPASASVRNILAAMPGLRLHAGADEGHLGDVGVVARRRWRRSRPRLAARSPRPRPCRPSGTVKVMSVVPSVDVFCTIMSTLTFGRGERLEERGRDARAVGHADDRDLGLAHVV